MAQSFIARCVAVTLLAQACLIATAPSHAAQISATVTYTEVGGPDDETGGNPVGDVITISNTSDVGEITSLVIQLGANLLFDTDVPSDTAGTDPAFAFSTTTLDPLLVSGANVLDGATQLNLSFSGFGPGEAFTFAIDVDQTGQNNDNQNRQVIGNQFAGTATFTFTGSFVGSPVALNDTFDGSGQTASASVGQDVPEPTGLALALAGVWIAGCYAAVKRHL